MRVLLLSILVAFLLSLATTIEKYYVFSKFTPKEFLIIQGVVLTVFALLYNSPNLSSNLNNLKNKCVQSPPVLLIPLIGIFGLVVFWHMLKNYDSASISAIITPLNLLFIIMFSYFIFKEKVTYYKSFGMIVALIGVVMMVKK